MKSLRIIIILSILFSSAGISFSQSGPPDPGVDAFLSHLRTNWDDIHDVVMRFHHHDPGLNGLVIINMEWINGRLNSASVDSNSTGNNDIGPDFIVALKKWNIPGLPERWESAIPLRVMIVGSENPSFGEKGIFTGRVTDLQGMPVEGSMIILRPEDIAGAKQDTITTNREGIFIWTLIEPGSWEIDCIKQGYRLEKTLKVTIEPGMHLIREISMLESDY